ncbi:fungal-specific transcription factor domain-containing protein [Dichotomocladium elegans]|nr:fungal-specific transcription factor domain-containing protein [Dichotomocladium elegans]
MEEKLFLGQAHKTSFISYIESLETRLKKMEALLEQMQSRKQQTDSVLPPETSSVPSHKRKRSLEGVQVVRSREDGDNSSFDSSNRNNDDGEEDDDDDDAEGTNKVVRYHGSSSGFYLMRNMLPETVKSKERGITIRPLGTGPVPSDGGNPSFRVRKLGGFDEDLVLVRDALDSDKNEAEETEELVPRKIMETLVHVYFDVQNATLPIISKQEYINAFEGRTSPPPSPLLTYAICTYSCFVISSDDPVFKECGMSCDQVFHTLSDRASHLIRRDYLTSGISTIKALVILCSQPTYSTSSYRNWILAGMAVRMAQDLGLHRTVRGEEASKEKIEASKRLWYSVYVTDRWCCAAMGRPLAIADSDCDVDLPDMVGADNKDYSIFVNFIKLSGILGEILRRIYSPKAKAAGYRGPAAEQTVANQQKMLSDWFAQLPDDCRITEEDLAAIRQNPDQFLNTKKLEQGGPLTVCYHSVTLLLHRPFIVFEGEGAAEQQQQQENIYIDAARRCMDAARMTIEIARVVPSASIARFGWNFSGIDGVV